MVRLAHYMGIVHPGGAFEVSTTTCSIQVYTQHVYYKCVIKDYSYYV